ncbi:unnamed protein product [Tilletia controversa]|nr:unnamed protein product [Tilletia controversa]CAD6904125.1 unnamed protein product [Tilletia controversa]CAD6951133.1 unnamed protein product [Tilletia caries]
MTVVPGSGGSSNPGSAPAPKILRGGRSSPKILGSAALGEDDEAIKPPPRRVSEAVLIDSASGDGVGAGPGAGNGGSGAVGSSAFGGLPWNTSDAFGGSTATGIGLVGQRRPRPKKRDVN